MNPFAHERAPMPSAIKPPPEHAVDFARSGPRIVGIEVKQLLRADFERGSVFVG
jgi:hypothetical protein